MTTELVSGLTNIKKHRLSRMQRIIVAVLQESYTKQCPGIFDSDRHIGRIALLVAQRYGNESFTSPEEWKEHWKAAYDGISASDTPSKELDLLLLQGELLMRARNHKARYGNRSAKFCVSFCRSLKNLEEKGLVRRWSSPYYRSSYASTARSTHIELTGEGKALNVNKSN